MGIPFGREIKIEGRFCGEDSSYYINLVGPYFHEEEVYRRIHYDEGLVDKFSFKSGIWISRVFEEERLRRELASTNFFYN